MIKGLLFDLDGTLVNTKEANYLSYKEAYMTIGINLSRVDYSKVFGLRFDDMVEGVSPGLGDALRKKLRENKSIFYKKNLDMTILNPVLTAIIKNDTNFTKKALITTASKKNALEVLKFHNLDSLFDICIFGEDVLLGKPDPECYNLGIKSLGLSPNECLIFEDTLIGACAGKKAGASVVNISGWCA
jgi:beta-phosphoglucomutase